MDTIAAIATPPGRGALAILRISGPGVPRLALAVLGREPPARRAVLASFADAQGVAIDRGIAVFFPAPDSFTGEHVLELHGHGGAIVRDLLMQRVLELGCRPARPGEFSERAFLNGKMDMVQAEAVADLIDAGTATAARAAMRSLQGEFSARVGELQALIIALRVHVEAAIDFPDEGAEVPADPAVTGRLAQVLGLFDSIESAARQGALLREGFTAVIAGRPNAGKSSLLNRLAGDDIAIVTPSPGTTRDVLRQPLSVDGLPLTLIDTAGLRRARGAAEQEGIRRARDEMRRADLILYVVDASLAAGEREALDLARGLARDAVLEDELPADVPLSVVFNKIDLTSIAPHAQAAGAAAAGRDEPTDRAAAPEPGRDPATAASLRAAPAAARAAAPARIYVSARTGAGIDLLRAHLKACAGYGGPESGTDALGARRRHLDALRRSLELVQGAARGLAAGAALELFAEDLRLAHRALGEITGQLSSEDLLGKIFGSFCIGK